MSKNTEERSRYLGRQKALEKIYNGQQTLSQSQISDLRKKQLDTMKDQLKWQHKDLTTFNRQIKAKVCILFNEYFIYVLLSSMVAVILGWLFDIYMIPGDYVNEEK